MEVRTTDILIVGGGTGGTAAAIQAARRGQHTGIQVIVVSDYSWLGGMLTAAGVSAPDGNELRSLQTGLWGRYLQTIQQRQWGGIDHGWVSCFTYDPRIGAAIFADWVQTLPNLDWISGQRPVSVERRGDRLTGVTFDTIHINASIILDGTELGDVLALGDVPYRWGWDGIQGESTQWNEGNEGNEPDERHEPDKQNARNEPSAPTQPNTLTQTYPVQLPTWVVVMQDFSDDPSVAVPSIPSSPLNHNDQFTGAWDGYGVEMFLNYGRLPGDRFMINWPQRGNDYGQKLDRLVQSEHARQQWLQEARWHTQDFARYIQQHVHQHLGRQYGLATDVFPHDANSLGGGAYALYPYFRESRRLRGLVTVMEQDILPQSTAKSGKMGNLAPLPINETGEVEAIAIGNYANDHHYPAPQSQLLSLKPKSMPWGGRWTGTPFALPYRCLVPATVDGLLACDKNISVSHIANGATRLQPVVMNLGQAAGMAAALCIERRCQPRELPVRCLQEALLTDAIAPAAIIPLLDIVPNHPDWLQWQRYYLERDHRLDYFDRNKNQGLSTPIVDDDETQININDVQSDLLQGNLLQGNDTQGNKTQSDFIQGNCLQQVIGTFQRVSEHRYALAPPDSTESFSESCFNQYPSLPLITLEPSVYQTFQQCADGATVTIVGYWNTSGPWMRVGQMVSTTVLNSTP